MHLETGVAVTALDLQALSRNHEHAGELPNQSVLGANDVHPITELAIGTTLPEVYHSSCSGLRNY